MGSTAFNIGDDCSPGKHMNLRRTLKVGDTVRYIGEKPYFGVPFAEGPLPINAVKNGYAYCTKPDGYFTTWISLSELRLETIEPRRSTQHSPTGSNGET